MLIPGVFVHAPVDIDHGSVDASEQLSGWTLLLGPLSSKASPDVVADDFIWPVNLPLRSNPWQEIGTSYGIAAVDKLGRLITFDFLLNKTDFLKIRSLENDRESYTERYFAALKRLPLGQIRFSPMSYVTTPDGLGILKLTFRIKITAPRTFAFSKALTPRPSVCPARKS